MSYRENEYEDIAEKIPATGKYYPSKLAFWWAWIQGTGAVCAVAFLGSAITTDCNHRADKVQNADHAFEVRCLDAHGWIKQYATGGGSFCTDNDHVIFHGETVHE